MVFLFLKYTIRVCDNEILYITCLYWFNIFISSLEFSFFSFFNLQFFLIVLNALNLLGKSYLKSKPLKFYKVFLIKP